MAREAGKAFRLQRLYNKILSEWHYAKFVKAVDESLKNKTPIKIVVRDKEVLKNIVVPNSLMEIQRNLSTSLSVLISSILNAFDIEYRFGYTPKSKSILNLIHRYDGISDAEKAKLIAYITQHLHIDGGL